MTARTVAQPRHSSVPAIDGDSQSASQPPSAQLRLGVKVDLVDGVEEPPDREVAGVRGDVLEHLERVQRADRLALRGAQVVMKVVAFAGSNRTRRS